MTLAVTVYSRPTCAGCNATKRHLARIEIPYTEVDIDVDDQPLMDSFEELGHRGAPIVCVTTPAGNQDWSGYRPDRIDALRAFR